MLTYISKIVEKNDREESVAMYVERIHGLNEMATSWTVHLRPFVFAKIFLSKCFRYHGNDNAIDNEMNEDETTTS